MTTHFSTQNPLTPFFPPKPYLRPLSSPKTRFIPAYRLLFLIGGNESPKTASKSARQRSSPARFNSRKLASISRVPCTTVIASSLFISRRAICAHVLVGSSFK